MTYRTEFPEFTETEMPEIPASWSDLSWHNDACPFFLISDSLGLWVDFADPAHSDFGADRAGRFILVPMIDGQHPIENSEELLATDDWRAILAKAIGIEFVKALRADLTDQEFAEVRKRNAARTPGVCHSHDFCDANMPMARAFESVMGREPDVADQGDANLWSNAWEGAMPDLTENTLASAAKALLDEVRDWQDALGVGGRPSLDQAIANLTAALATRGH